MLPTVGSLALLLVVAIALGFVVLRWPEVGALLATAVVYLNLLPIAIRYHHVSPVFAAVVAALVVPALLKHWAIDRNGLVIDQPFLLMLVFLASLSVSSLFSRSIEVALPWVARYFAEGILLYLLFVNLIRSASSLRRYAWVVVLCGAFLASLTVYQEITGSYATTFGGLAARTTARETPLGEHVKHTQEGIRDTQRGQGADLDANRYAQILIVLLPLAWCLVRNEATMHGRVAAAICASLILGGVLLTYSRGAFVGLLGMFGLMAALRTITFRQLLITGAALALLVALVSPGYFGRMETLRGIEGLLDQGSGSAVGPDPVQQTRATIMLTAWRVFLDHPIIGVGPGEFAAIYVIEYGAELYLMDVIDRHYFAHSLYLQLAAETGVIGLGVFMAIVGATLVRLAVAFRYVRTLDRSLADWTAALVVSISTYLVTAMFLHFGYQRYFWLLLALGGATVLLARSRMIVRTHGAVPAAEFPTHRR